MGDLQREVLQADDAKSQGTDAPNGLRGAGGPTAPPVGTFKGLICSDTSFDLHIDTPDAPKRASRTIVETEFECQQPENLLLASLGKTAALMDLCIRTGLDGCPVLAP